jgi:hypothetical protein
MGETRLTDLGIGSPVYAFETGKSFFRAFALPESSSPYEVSVESYLVGGYLKKAYLFSPQIVTLDKNRAIVGTSGPDTFKVERAGLVEALQRAEGLEQKLSGSITFDGNDQRERYLVIYTTDVLLKERTSVPISGENSIWTIGGAKTVREEIEIPHAAAGKIAVTMRPLRPGSIAATLPTKSGSITLEPPEKFEVPRAPPGIETPAPEKSVYIRKNELEKTPAKTNVDFKNPVFVATHHMNGTALGPLELGKTMSSEARQHFAKSGITTGTENSSSVSLQIGSVQLLPRLLYLPTATPHQLYFDSNDKLILFVDSAPSDLPNSSSEFLQQFPGMWESGRSASFFKLQTALSHCVTLIASFRTIDDSLGSVSFAYTCTTSK